MILGLLTVFGNKTQSFNATIKVGIASLSADILFGFVLVGFVLTGVPYDDQRTWIVTFRSSPVT